MAESPKKPSGLSRVVRKVKAFVTASASTRERGYTHSGTPGTWWGDLTGERTPELQWPKSIEVYEDIPRQDSQASSVLSAVTTPILRARWAIDGTGCDPAHTAFIADQMGLPIVGEEEQPVRARARGRFSWTEHLEVAVNDHLQFGHAVFEQQYWPPVPVDDGGDGLFHLRKLGYRPARTIAEWLVARDGGLIGIRQYESNVTGSAITGFTGMPSKDIIKVNRLVVYVNKKRGSNWIGISLLRPAYKNVLLKDLLLRIDSQVAQRNGMGVPVHTAADDTDEALEAGLEIASAVGAGDDSGVSLAKDAKLELVGVTGNLPDILEKVKYHDEQIARAVLAHFLNLGSQTGSWALGSAFADFFTLSIQSIAENVRETAQRYIIDDLMDINYGTDARSPRLVVEEIGSRQESILAAIAQLVSAGVLRKDENTEAWVRSKLGIPGFDGTELGEGETE